MSQTDSFIDEVTEEVRRDRLFGLIRRYGWIAVLVVLVVVAGAAWNEYRKAQERTAAQALGDALLSALEQDTPAERVSALDAVDATTPGQQAIRGLLESSEAAAADDPEGAADTLMQVAGSSDLPKIYRDIARFKALGLQAGQRDPAERRADYEALANSGSALRLLADEQIALTYVEAGETDEAIARLRAILEDAELTTGLRQRASQLIVALGADPAAPDGAAAGSE
ncbi:hypothetical protein GLS40_10910 [Pseudooceanicola sp. 216_PA32_1]|uniref:Ancillary SecYEG translocon subunit/Cell division coordinator CpoB TPR domain-containing protein n=1 Tax=Pseudooceanicola pacificus TaxID=2676438 RepID=A0A844W3Y5_9RHOB|nr:tetratricopeptide repeat protein [Pseudooceanicola pacificus]MWB78537.1 hypothetical protein [Pseudooceanicola pacificus]